MAGITELIIGIVILNILFRIIRGLTSKEQKKPPVAPRVKKTWEPAWETEKEPAAPEVTVDKFEKLMGESGAAPPVPVAQGDEEKSWVEDLFETVEREFEKKEAPAYDKGPVYDRAPAYDKKTAYDELPSYDEKPALAEPQTPLKVKAGPAPRWRFRKRPMETVPSRMTAAVVDALRDNASIRTAIVLSTVLGPCRAKRRYRSGPRRIT